VARTSGTVPLAFGAFLLVGGFLFVLLVSECSIVIGCLFQLPAFFYTLDVTFLALMLLLIGVMLVAAGGLLRARARLPTRIV
jgi:hypothetical protein